MKTATSIAPIGIVADATGQTLNLSRWAIAHAPVAQALCCKPRVISVLGTSMNSGKTTIAQSLVQGFVRRGLHGAAGKVTGTGSGGDRWSILDAGAEPVLDFTDAGVPSTFGLSAERIENIFETLVTALSTPAPDVIVLEVADGLCQQETAALIASPVFRTRVDGIVFAAGEALGAKAGVDILASLNLPILAVSGLITASPLASREAAALLSPPLVPNTDIAAGMWTPDLPLLRGTLERNLRYRCPDASDDEFAQTLRDCGLEQVIARLPDGLSSRLSDGGVNLSQGVRQRVALARALLGRPRILLLDEVDTHLDAASARTLDRILETFPGTVLLATHDRARAARADCIWHLEQGALVACGTPGELLVPGSATSRLLARPSLSIVA